MQSYLLLCNPEYVPIPGEIRSMVPTHNPNEILVQTIESTFYVYNTITLERTELRLNISEYDTESVLLHADSKCIIFITNYFTIMQFTHKKGSWDICTKFKMNCFSITTSLENFVITGDHIFNINPNSKELRMFNRNTLKLHDKFELPCEPIIGWYVDACSIIVASKSCINVWFAINSKFIKKYNYPNEYPKFFKVICNSTYIVCFNSPIDSNVLNIYILSTSFEYINKFTINEYYAYESCNAWFVTNNHICIVDPHMERNEMWYVDILNLNIGYHLEYNKPTITAYDSTKQLISLDCKFITNSCDQLIIQRYTTIKQILVAMLCFYQFELPNEIIHNIMLFLKINTYARNS